MNFRFRPTLSNILAFLMANVCAAALVELCNADISIQDKFDFFKLATGIFVWFLFYDVFNKGFTKLFLIIKERRKKI